MNDHLKGLLITTLGVLLVVPDSLFVRLIGAEPLVTAFWRGLMAGAAFRAVYRSGWPAVIYTVLLGTTTPAFVLAVENTSVANVVFIFASMPVFAALFSRVFLGESVSRRMVVTMVAVFVGLAIIAFGSSAVQIASWRGDLWALYVSAAFAAALTAARKAKATSMVPTIPPILVWWVIGEDPGSLAVVGGAVVIGALVVSNVYNLVSQRRA